MAIDLSICTVNYRVSPLVERLLRSIVDQPCPFLLEILVVDNDSGDDIREVVASYPLVSLVCNPQNRYFTGADNQNLARARGEYILSINPDCTISPGSLEAMVHLLASDRSIGAVAPIIQYPDSTCQSSTGSFITLGFGLLEFSGLKSSRLKRILSGNVKPRANDPEVLYGACIMTRREVLEKVGLKDERLVHGWDEYDWSKRIRDAGFRLAVCTDATVVHHRGASTRKLSETEGAKLTELHYEGLLYLYRKHFGMGVYLLMKSLHRLRKAWEGTLGRMATGKTGGSDGW